MNFDRLYNNNNNKRPKHTTNPRIFLFAETSEDFQFGKNKWEGRHVKGKDCRMFIGTIHAHSIPPPVSPLSNKFIRSPENCKFPQSRTRQDYKLFLVFIMHFKTYTFAFTFFGTDKERGRSWIWLINSLAKYSLRLP